MIDMIDLVIGASLRSGLGSVCNRMYDGMWQEFLWSSCQKNKGILEFVPNIIEIRNIYAYCM